MVATDWLHLYISTIKEETQIRLLGFSRIDENLRSDFGTKIGESESRCDFNARSCEESSSTGRV